MSELEKMPSKWVVIGSGKKQIDDKVFDSFDNATSFVKESFSCDLSEPVFTVGSYSFFTIGLLENFNFIIVPKQTG
jgi:hypothetical protein